MDNNRIPPYAEKALDILEGCGFEAYFAGGCVRDSLLGREPHDWDITTSARPEEVISCFEGCRVIPTGIKHGTVSVIICGETVEITTYRVDGVYTDSRRPDSVTFASKLKDDLSRRDFTVNAFAYHPRRGLVDCFGGIADLECRTIRCVGDPEKRFTEDALRILRGARFAAELGFAVEKNTFQAMLSLRANLKKVSSERIAAELKKILRGQDFARIFLEMPDLFFQIIPELEPCAGFQEPGCRHNLYEQVIRSAGLSPRDTAVRFALLLQDTAKPAVFERTGSFHGHETAGAETAEKVMSRLRYDKAAITRVALLARNHGVPISPDIKSVMRLLSKIGANAFRQLIEVQTALQRAEYPCCADSVTVDREAVMAALERILSEGMCYRIEDLGVNGDNLIEAGIPQGKMIGYILNGLLDRVIDGKVTNEKTALLEAARELAKGL